VIITFSDEKSGPIIGTTYFCYFRKTTQSKQSPIGHLVTLTALRHSLSIDDSVIICTYVFSDRISFQKQLGTASLLKSGSFLKECAKRNIFVLETQEGYLSYFNASRTEDPGFESRQCVRFLGINTLQCCFKNVICIVTQFFSRFFVGCFGSS
jgi:hypothetical protein